ncbi:hypothetical protein [Thalassospira sp.]|uniref:hypothetical protein n=1 Tax=Thalassospira sp. TaxID=1912094 RepID=UPI000C569D97|nr:hypothetical protein [Thalassospira sp.]MBC06968.1 hypothetical protein [Thalassospira sp.]|tara:strand:+ start:1443 stop:2342 length:900 start_codon:yes stop_codon:yes gene_type:complete
MVGQVNANGVNAPALGQNSPVDNGNAQNDGIIAKGIGVMKKIFLHISGKAADVHAQQLSNLKAQVRNEMGEGGLAALSKTLERHHWDGEDSTKLFSSSELKSLRTETAHIKDIDERLAAKKADFSSNIDTIMSTPQLKDALVEIMTARFSMENVQSLEAIEGYCSGDIQPTTQQEFQDLLNVCNTYFESADDPMDDGDPYRDLDPNTQVKTNLSGDLKNQLDDKKHALQGAMANGTLQDKTDAANELIAKFSAVKTALGNLITSNIRNEPVFTAAVERQAQAEIKAEVLHENLQRSGLI